jgi:hypothetical protein
MSSRCPVVIPAIGRSSGARVTPPASATETAFGRDRQRARPRAGTLRVDGVELRGLDECVENRGELDQLCRATATSSWWLRLLRPLPRLDHRRSCFVGTAALLVIHAARAVARGSHPSDTIHNADSPFVSYGKIAPVRALQDQISN